MLVRYADDLVALCHTRDAGRAGQGAAGRVAGAQRVGLQRGQDTDRCLDEGSFDFLGFNVRRYREKLLIKPSKAALRRIRERLRAEMWALRGANALAVLRKINPIVRGWSAYYRTVVSSEAFTALDDYVWKLTYKWAKHSHQNKSRHWIVDRYFGQFNKARQDRWVFGDRDSGAYLLKFSWTKIVRHQMVTGTSSLDDPALTDYWAERRRTGPPLPIDNARLLKTQAGAARSAGTYCCSPTTSPKAHKHGSVAGGHPQSDDHTARRRPREPRHRRTSLRLIHAHCQRGTPPNRQRPSTSACPRPHGACLSRMR